MSEIEPNAYTLGNPEVYDEALAKGRVEKQPGGAVFWTQEDARAALVEGRNGTYLPEEWFPGSLPIPGAVYGMVVDPYWVDRTKGPVGEMVLTAPARITGKFVRRAASDTESTGGDDG